MVGAYMIRAERSSDNACFYAIMSLRESLVGIEKERLAEFIEEKIKHCFYTLEHVSGALDRKDGVPSAEEIQESDRQFRLAFTSSHPEATVIRASTRIWSTSSEKCLPSSREVYGAKVA